MAGKILVSIVIVDSRSKIKPLWVQTAINSAERQSIEQKEIIVVDNTKNNSSIIVL